MKGVRQHHHVLVARTPTTTTASLRILYLKVRSDSHWEEDQHGLRYKFFEKSVSLLPSDELRIGHFH